MTRSGLVDSLVQHGQLGVFALPDLGRALGSREPCWRERTLDHAAVHSAVTDADVAALVEKLAGFYARVERAPWSPAEYVRRLAAKVQRYGAQFEELDVPFDKIAGL